MVNQPAAVGNLIAAFLFAGFALLVFDASAPGEGVIGRFWGIVRETDDGRRKVSFARAGSFVLGAVAAYMVARAVIAFACA